MSVKCAGQINNGMKGLSPPACQRRDFLRSVLVGGLAALTAPVTLGEETAAKPTPTPQQLAAAVVGSSIGLILGGEGRLKVGSATLVEAPGKMQQLLHPDEFLALSVSHNFDDWGDRSKVMAILYSQISADGKGSSPVKCEARLIDRFVEPSKTTERFPSLGARLGTVDVALVAVRIPHDQRAKVEKLLVPISEAAPTNLARARFVAVGYGDHTPEGLLGRGEPIDLSTTLPPVSWREGSIISVNSHDCNTQYGVSKHVTVRTNAPTVPGDSGGGLFLWNPTRQRIELVAICSTGNRVGKNVADFDDIVPDLSRLIGVKPGVDAKLFPPDSIIYRSEDELAALQNKLRRKAGGWILDSDFRAGFGHVRGVNALIEYTAARYKSLVVERTNILATLKRIEGDLNRGADSSAEQQRQQRADIKLLTEKALLEVNREIARLRPPR